MKITLALVLSVLILSSVILTPNSIAFAEKNNDSKQPNEKAKGLIPDQYIIVFKEGASKDNVPKAYGLTKIHKYDHALNGFAVKASAAQIEKLKNDDRVLFVQQDRIINITAQSLPAGIDRIDADLNPLSKIDGIDERVDVDVAIIDTGIDRNHPDLNVAGGINFVGSDPNAWQDGHGHGTHVSGTVAALDNGEGVVGVAPGARVWAVKVLSDSGSGTWSDVIQGVDWVTANSDVIEVVNMSLGGTASDDGNCGLTNSDALHYAICNSVASGVVYVVAAGNSASDSAGHVPAAYDEVITVSAIADFDGIPGGLGSYTCRFDVDDTFADFSNFGADVDIAAPGVCVRSSLPGGVYASWSGTSMASPHVAGAAALYIVENGKPSNAFGVQMVKQGLIDAAIPQNDQNGFTGDRDVYAEPLLNVGQTAERNPFHDVSVDQIIVSSPINQGDTVPVEIDIGNYGDFDEILNVTLTDTNTSDIIGLNTISIPSGQTDSFVIDWDTSTAALGQHTIEASVNPVPEETNLANNVMSVTVSLEDIDVTAPTVIISEPQDGAVLKGNAFYNITASDNVDIKWVELFFDGEYKRRIFPENNEPYHSFISTLEFSEGPHVMTAIAFDNAGNTGQYSIDINVVRNFVPIAVDDNYETNGQSTLTIPAPGVLGNDIDEDIEDRMVPIIQDKASNGTAYIYQDGTVKYTPNSGFRGIDHFTYKVTDYVSCGPLVYCWSNLATVTITVHSGITNTQPTTTGISDVVVNKGTTSTEIALYPVFEDAEDADENLTYEIYEISDTTLFENTRISSNGVLTLEYVQDKTGESMITLVATDTGNLSVFTDFLVTVNEALDLPPSVSITNPADGSNLKRPTTISAVTEGLGDNIVVKFFLDGNLFSTDTSSPYEFKLNPNKEKISGGIHIISAEASDSNGNKAAASIEVTVPQKGKVNQKDTTKSSINNFEEGVVVVHSSRTTAVDLIKIELAALEELDENDISNLGYLVSKVANLHKMVDANSAEEREEFKELFHQYRNDVKSILGIGQGIEQKVILLDLNKAQQKLQMKINEAESIETVKNKITTAVELTSKKDELIKLRNHIATLEGFLEEGEEKDKKLKELNEKKLAILKEFMIAEAKHSNKELTEKEIKKIEEKAVEINNPKQSQSSDNNDDDKKKSNNGNNGNGNSDKGNSSKGNSDKGNSNKGNNGKGNSKK